MESLPTATYHRVDVQGYSFKSYLCGDTKGDQIDYLTSLVQIAPMKVTKSTVKYTVTMTDGSRYVVELISK